jgi:hypothetical protein
LGCTWLPPPPPACGPLRPQETAPFSSCIPPPSAYVSIRQHASA